MPIKRRTFLAATATGLAASATGGVLAPQIAQAATWKKRLTGADLDTNSRWQVAGTDLGIPYVLENGSIGYLFGDTFNSPWPEQQNNDWRSPVMLRSAVHPNAAGGIVFDSAARVAGNGRAPEIMHNGHNGIGIDNLWEVTVIPNDGISFPETGRQLVSYMSIEHWNAGPRYSLWKSRYAGIAFTDNGNDFVRTNLKWFNDADNADPFQMWTMQRMGDYVYIHSVRSGRQDGPMMLRRVRWDKLFSPEAYEGFGWNGTNWGWGRPCSPVLTGRFGEPSVRRLSNGIWVMVYLNAATGNIVSRWAYGPDTGWSNEKIQVTYAQEPGLYGGFIHPWSGSAANELHLMVSKWTRDPANNSTAYHMSQYVGTV
ncbi:DUF4185 domain-containing protein [Kribbella sp. NPDC051587]|uniref:DUF4185 domain-containing protein n=1 Tax=Kribbella sp. NPDC051587 TaxID=3364119 RepID=UPI0037B86DA8